MEEGVQSPTLKLTLADDDRRRNYLVSGIFKCAEGEVDLTKVLPDFGKPARALCILLMVVKFRGPTLLKNRMMEFDQDYPDRSWISTLGDWDQILIRGMFEKCFLGETFLDTKRAVKETGKPSRVTYFAATLAIENLKFFRSSGTGLPSDKETPIEDDDLLDFAKRLESDAIWTPRVPYWEERTRGDPKWRKALGGGRMAGQTTRTKKPLIYTAQWEEFTKIGVLDDEELLNRLKKPPKNDQWYIVSIAPFAPLRFLGNYLDTAVRDFGVRVKWVYHSLHAVRRSKIMQAQWRMIQPFCNFKGDIRKEARRKLDEGKRTLLGCASAHANWSSQNGKNGGGFEFYQSSMVHYFMAFMAVPQPSTNNINGKAPDNTICLVQPYPMFPDNYDDRVGIFLKSPHEVLDVYYRSILQVFEEGLKRRLVKPDKTMIVRQSR